MWLLKEKLKEYDIEITLPPKHIKYDYSIKLFKELKKGKKIEDLVKKIIDKIYDFVESYEVVNGYLNININWENALKKWKDLFKFKNKDKKVIIEHTSVNPNKALHIGHLRNSILGDSLVRLFKFLGYKTEVLNYIDDTGTQVADVLLGFYYLKFPENPEEFNEGEVVKNIVEFLKNENLYKEKVEDKIREIIKERKEVLKKLYGYEIPKKFDHYCGDFIYVIVNKLYEAVPELEKYRSYIIKKIEEGNNEIYYLNRRIVRRVLLDQLKTLFNFDITFDLFNKESDIIHFNLWKKTFELLKENEVVVYVTEGEKKGTWSVDLKKLGLGEDYKVLVRSNGTTVYLAKDIAYAFWKHGLINIDFKYSKFLEDPEIWETDINGIENPKGFGKADISINVIGSEQEYLQKIIQRIIEKIDKSKRYIHYSYGLVMLSRDTANLFGIKSEKEYVRMSGRKGIFINVDNLLEKVFEVAKEKLKERNKDLDEKSLNNLAFRIARSTIAFEILRYDKKTTVVFDIDKMTNIEEGNALYLMYTYARINSLLEKSGIKNFEDYIRNVKDLNDRERRLLRQIFMFKDVIMDVEKSLEINKLAEYLINLALIFNEFYQNLPILKELDKKPYRIFLVFLTKLIFEKLFDILKIDKIKRI